MPPRIGPPRWLRLLQQRRGAPVDEALHQLLVQRVGEPVLERAGLALPVRGIGEPVAAVGDIGERAHAGEPRRQRVDVALEPVERGELALHPVVGQAAVALGQVLEHAADQPRVLLLRGLAEVRRLADVPQPDEVGAVAAAARRRVSSPASWRSVVSSWLSSASLRPGFGGGAASERIRPASDEKSSRALRHSAAVNGAKAWPSTAATTSASISGASPVTPNVPSRR